MTRHGFGRLLALTLMAGSLALGSIQAMANEAIHIGVSNRSLFGLPVLVAQQKGFFKEEGVEVTIDYFGGGTPATAALIGGSVQFIDAAFENNVKTVKRGQPIVTVMNIQTDFAGAIIVRKDIADKFGGKPTLENLKGLRLGTLARGGFADVSARYVLHKAGLEPDVDVQLVPIKGSDRQLTAGEAGEIEAAFVMEPYGAIGVEGQDKWAYVINITAGEGPDVFQGLGYITLQTTRDYVKEHRPTVEKVVRALVKAQSYINDPKNIDELSSIADKEYGGAGVDIMKVSIERQVHAFQPAMNPKMVDKTVELLVSSKSIEAPAPSYEEVVDTSFAPLWEQFKK
ncbi:NitT/TauT family transport system substrate-binding protein [Rhodoligotrophos appendicifer]|uniref:ABC transporter substrate-binding protein n=1 Tax=Rhodoligotrophos appendicifer TaxID=987056 RepID=UPI001186EC39|nr:ABC transporter substrate-binding protein [Rhodoligotrophos appendicifer]